MLLTLNMQLPIVARYSSEWTLFSLKHKAKHKAFRWELLWIVCYSAFYKLARELQIRYKVESQIWMASYIAVMPSRLKLFDVRFWYKFPVKTIFSFEDR